MSFALEYRKKLTDRLQREAHEKKANEGFVSLPLEPSTETPRNRRVVLLALVLAGAVLGVFNSGGLVQYAYGLSESRWGQKLVVASERWHELMQDNQATRVMDEIRGSVAFARASNWSDIVASFGAAPGNAVPSDRDIPNVMPANMEQQPVPDEPEQPRTARPEGPVMRASAERLD